MNYRCVVLALFTLTVVGAVPSRAGDNQMVEDRSVENLAAFARVYGYVRFFHPSEQAVSVDWDRFGIMGAEAVRDTANREELRMALLRIFQPIAPRLHLNGATSDATDVALPAVSATDGQLTFWQYVGIKLYNQPGPYRQQRVIVGEEHGARAPIFRPAIPPAILTKMLSPGLVLHLPLALPVGADGATLGGHPAEFAALQKQIAAIDLKSITPTDWRLRVAGVVTVWNVFQHFHPYLDGIGVKWDEALKPALRRALRDRTADDYRATLSELVAQSRDGHGLVDGSSSPTIGFPIRVALVEDQIVVTAVAAGSPFRRGDVIAQLDGVAAIEVLRAAEHCTPGSPQLSEFRALNQFGQGSPNSSARLDLERDGQAVTLEFPRPPDHRSGYFSDWFGEFKFPGYAEVRPGIIYVNLHLLDARSLAAKMSQLATARGVIFDSRSDGRAIPDKAAKYIQPDIDIIPHLTDRTIETSPMLIPQILLPDRVGWTYLVGSPRSVQPKAPRFAGRVVFINDPGVVSYGETCMAMIADYHLATLVGAPTAGCNGNVNFIPLPGGFRIMWTGMDVRKHDGSPFYTIGFVPDFPVARTLRAVKEGRDEYLEKAIDVIEASAKPAEKAKPARQS